MSLTHVVDVGQTLLSHPDACLSACVLSRFVSDSLRAYGPEPTRLLCPWNSPGKNTGVSSHSLFQGILPTQGLNPFLLQWTREVLTTRLGEGSGTPLQYSCLENPMDGGAWWATVHGVAKSRI